MYALGQPVSPSVVIGVQQDQFRRRRGKLGYELAKIPRSRRHARLGLDRRDFAHTEPATQVGLIAMHDHDRHVLERRSLRLPSCHCLRPPFAEIGGSRGVVVRASRIDRSQFRRECLRDRRNVACIQLDMRIAERMNVTECAVQLARDLDQGDR
jgi:hypothetical protein